MAKLYVEPLFKDKMAEGRPVVKASSKSIQESLFVQPQEKKSQDKSTYESPLSIDAFVKNLSDDDRTRLEPTLQRLSSLLEAQKWEEALEMTELIEDILELSLL